MAALRHAFRTPINHIMGYTEIIQEEHAEWLTAGFLTDLLRIHGSGYALLALINQYFGEESTGGALDDLQSIGHELRTPVNQIIGYSELLAEECEELGRPALKADLGKIVAAAYHWLALVEKHLGGLLQPLPESPLVPPTGILTPAVTPIGQPHAIAMASQKTPQWGHLLLADDDEDNRRLLTRRLEKLGYRVTACGDGRSALELAKHVTPDLVLLDMLMPVLDGHETLVRIKSDPTLRHLPVIMISALDEVDTIARCIELGAEDYLAKPFNPVLLRSRIGAALENKRLRDGERLYLQQLEAERALSERLLLNVLPQPIATRLKNGETLIVNSYDEVTVLFADLVGFTPLCAQIPPSLLVSYLNQIFSSFDALAVRYELEKIKTIGDSYMAAAGIPFPSPDHAGSAAQMAMAMHETIEQFNRQHQRQLQMRIGLASGPVIAGVIGQNKFTYDLWGDTVNLASRMESHGVAGMTQIPAATFELLRGRIPCEARGTITVKGKGPMKTFFLMADSKVDTDLRC